MNRRLWFLLLAAALLLHGCSLAPDYNRPLAPIPSEWPQGPAYEGTQTVPGAAGAAELSWQEFFSDEQLRTIIETALANNLDLRLVALKVERVRALYGIQRAELYPALNAAGAGAKQQRSVDLIGPGDARTTEQYSLNLGLASWEIDFFGRTRSLSEQALNEYLATEQGRRSARILLISEVSRAYLTLAKDRENLSLAQSTLEDQQGEYDIIQRRYDVGVATELDLRRAQTRVDAARRDVASFSQQLAQDHNRLNLLCGCQLSAELLPADLSSLTPPRPMSAGLSSATLLNRPDIVAAEYRLKGAYARIGAARAAFFPRISLTTSVGTASDALSGLFTSGTDVWNFAPQLVLPIFDGRIWAAFRLSEAEQQIVLTEYEKTIQVAFREVADALAVQGTIDRQLAAQQSLVDALAETYGLANKRYLGGLDSYLGVLDAQRTLYGARRVLISLNLAKLANRVNLYAVLGGGAG
ncbi:efflux transporter outer membrane subunit [Desulfogranum mediterraneum]|uniref:efflux transporter outer membrane subunit n=1 Tax=Desulfogranum mediterraneum TaxID=160661 RepID=UPI00040FE485|nr:efflux transporter outer membrane subunit [Desulfogranum mediterraneum]